MLTEGLCEQIAVLALAGYWLAGLVLGVGQCSGFRRRRRHERGRTCESRLLWALGLIRRLFPPALRDLRRRRGVPLNVAVEVVDVELRGAVRVKPERVHRHLPLRRSRTLEVLNLPLEVLHRAEELRADISADPGLHGCSARLQARVMLPANFETRPGLLSLLLPRQVGPAALVVVELREHLLDLIEDEGACL